MPVETFISKINELLGSIDTLCDPGREFLSTFVRPHKIVGFVISRPIKPYYKNLFDCVQDLFVKHGLLGEMFYDSARNETYPLINLERMNDETCSQVFLNDLSELCNSYNEIQKRNRKIVRAFLSRNDLNNERIEDKEQIEISLPHKTCISEIAQILERLNHPGVHASPRNLGPSKEDYFIIIKCDFDTIQATQLPNATNIQNHSIVHVVRQLQHTINHSVIIEIVYGRETMASFLTKIKCALEIKPPVLGIIIPKTVQIDLATMKQLHKMIVENNSILSITGFDTGNAEAIKHAVNHYDEQEWNNLKKQITDHLKKNQLDYYKKISTIPRAATASAAFVISDKRANKDNPLRHSLCSKTSEVPSLIKQFLFGKIQHAEEKGNAAAAPTIADPAEGFFENPRVGINRLETFSDTRFSQNEVARLKDLTNKAYK